MLKILDKYIVRQFLQIIAFGLLTFLFIFIIIDLMENLDDFIDQSVPLNIVLQYYVNFIPEILRLMLPVSVLLAGLFTAGKMSNLNELTAIKASGVSLYRFVVPFLVTSFVISLFAIYFGGFVVPQANKHKVDIERSYMKKGFVRSGSNIFFQDSPSRIVTISYYDIINQKANRVSVQEFEEQNLVRMIYRIDAKRMRYDSTNSSWILYKGIRRDFTDSKVLVQKFDSLAIGYLNFTPEQIIKKQRKPEEMTLAELEEYANELFKTGTDPTRIYIEYNSRLAFAFASFIVVLFGVTISANKRSGSLALQFGISILLTFVYLVFMKLSQAFGKNGLLDPFITAWSANIVFFLAGVANLIRVQK